MWLTFRDGVYDLTEFIKVHPGGGEKLIMAKGGPIEPWWNMYSFHKETAILSLLAQYKVGILHPDDRIDEKSLPDMSAI